MYLDILGMVEIEVRGEGEKPRNYLRKEYSSFEVDETSGRDPDIIIELVEDVSSEEKSVHVRGPVAYDEKGVFLHHNLPGDVEYNACRIDFNSFGSATTKVSCDRNFNSHFFAIVVDYLIHFHLLDQDAVLFHSCGFKYNGKSIVCPAWRHVGKTNLLLSFREEGVHYIADDWSVIHREGAVSTLPKRLNILYYNFKRHPELLEKTTQEFQSLFNFIKRARSGEIDLNKNVIDTLTNQARMRIPPGEIFDEVERQSNSIDYIFLLKRSHSDDCDVSQRKIDPEVFPHRKQSILDFEQSYFLLAYEVHKSHTGQVSEYLEQSTERSLDIIQDAAESTPEIREVTVPSQDDSPQVKEVIKETVNVS